MRKLYYVNKNKILQAQCPYLDCLIVCWCCSGVGSGRLHYQNFFYKHTHFDLLSRIVLYQKSIHINWILKHFKNLL